MGFTTVDWIIGLNVILGIVAFFSVIYTLYIGRVDEKYYFKDENKDMTFIGLIFSAIAGICEPIAAYGILHVLITAGTNSISIIALMVLETLRLVSMLAFHRVVIRNIQNWKWAITNVGEDRRNTTGI